MNDAIGVIGITTLATGLTIRYGADVACIIVGGILLALAIIGAIRK